MNARTLAFWKWRLGREGDGKRRKSEPKRRDGDSVAFVELLRPAPAAPASVETRAPLFEVMLPVGYRVRIAQGFERGALTELLDVLEARR